MNDNKRKLNINTSVLSIISVILTLLFCSTAIALAWYEDTTTAKGHVRGFTAEEQVGAGIGLFIDGSPLENNNVSGLILAAPNAIGNFSSWQYPSPNGVIISPEKQIKAHTFSIYSKKEGVFVNANIRVTITVNAATDSDDDRMALTYLEYAVTAAGSPVCSSNYKINATAEAPPSTNGTFSCVAGNSVEVILYMWLDAYQTGSNETLVKSAKNGKVNVSVKFEAI